MMPLDSSSGYGLGVGSGGKPVTVQDIATLTDVSARGIKHTLMGSVSSNNLREALPRFLDYNRSFINALNEALERHGRPDLKLRISDEGLVANRDLLTSKWVKHLLKYGFSAAGYCLFNRKIDVIAQALVDLLDDDFDNLAIHAETQWGKTIIMVMLILLMNHYNEVEAEKRGEPITEAVVLTNSNRNGPDAATKRDLMAARYLHAPVTFDVENRLYASNKDATLVIKKNGRGLSDIKNKLQKLKQRGITKITLFVDEADEALSNRTLYSQIVDAVRDKSLGVQVRLVLVSATGYAYENLHLKFRHIRVEIRPEDGYAGTVAGIRTPVMSLADYGRKWANGVQDIRPSLYRQSSSFEKWKKAWTRSHKRAERIADGMSDPDEIAKMSHRQYRKHCENAIITLVKSEVDNTPGHRFGPFGGGLGAMLRFGTSAAIMNKLLNSVESALCKMGVAILRHYDNKPAPAFDHYGFTLDDEDEQEDDPLSLKFKVKELLATQGTRYVMVAVMHAGRRADRLPACITRGWDFTEEFSTTPAAEQGTMGRLSGFGKITDRQETLALLSTANVRAIEMLRAYYDHYGHKFPILHINNTLRSSGRAFVRSNRIIVNLTDPKLPHRAAILRWISSRMRVESSTSNEGVEVYRLGVTSKNLTPGSRMAGRVPVFDLFQSCITPEVAKDILIHMDIPQARLVASWDSTAERGAQRDKDGYAAIAVARHGRGGRTGLASSSGSDAATRNKQRNTGQSEKHFTRNGARANLEGMLRPEFFFDDQKRPLEIHMHLHERVLMRASNSDEDLGIVLPTPDNMLWDMMDDQQKAWVLSTQEKHSNRRRRR